jgi:hypothetical protein
VIISRSFTKSSRCVSARMFQTFDPALLGRRKVVRDDLFETEFRHSGDNQARLALVCRSLSISDVVTDTRIIAPEELPQIWNAYCREGGNSAVGRISCGTLVVQVVGRDGDHLRSDYCRMDTWPAASAKPLRCHLWFSAPSGRLFRRLGADHVRQLHRVCWSPPVPHTQGPTDVRPVRRARDARR